MNFIVGAQDPAQCLECAPEPNPVTAPQCLAHRRVLCRRRRLQVARLWR